jgi:hypothetical protein
MIVGNVQYRGKDLTKQVVFPDRIKQVKQKEWLIVPLNQAKNLIETGDFIPDEETQKLFIKFDGSFDNRKYVDGMLLGKKCFLIGGGYSLKDFDFSILDPFYTIAINHSVIYYKNAKSCLFLDGSFLDKNNNEARKFLKTFTGLIFCSFRTEYQKENKKAIPFYVNKDRVEMNFTKGLYGSRLSGMAALSLALIMGSSEIYLLGYDLNDQFKIKHFYNNEKFSYKNEGGYVKERIRNHIRAFKVYIPFKDRIFNLSQSSKIPFFEFKTIGQAIKE